jgi:hypothetical protein
VAGEQTFVRRALYRRAMDTIRRGNAAEAAVLNAFIRADLHVFVPFGDGCPYDLVVECGTELVRVQVKCGRIRNECIEFNSSSTDHGRGQLSYEGRADVFGVHAHQLDRVYIVPVEGCARLRGYLRLVPTRNNQQRGVRYAGDYAVEDWARSLSRAAA